MMQRLLLTAILVVASVSSAWAGLRQDIEERLHDTISEALEGQDANIVIRTWRMHHPEHLQSATALRDLRIARGARAVGLVTIRVDFDMPDGKVVSTLLSAEVDATVPVWVVRRRIGRGAPLNSWNVGVAERPLARLSRNALRANQSLLGKVASRPLSPGMVMTTTTITTPILVTKKQGVNVSVQVGNVQVRTNGKALRSGRRGEQVPVRLRASGRILQAEVTGHNKVSVNR